MQKLFQFVADNPWVWIVILACVAVWIGALVAVFKSEKFLRKWLWAALATFVTFSISWSLDPRTTIGFGVPIGALYVLWFWRFGPSPTAEQVAKAERRKSAAVQQAGAARVTGLRASYGLAAAAALLVGWEAVSGGFAEWLAALGFDQDPMIASLLPAMGYAQGALAVLFAGLFLFLAFRPYWWGKLLCLWAAVSWLGFVAASSLLFRGANVSVLVAGVAMLIATVALQLLDPRFSGSYLRTAASGSS